MKQCIVDCRKSWYTMRSRKRKGDNANGDYSKCHLLSNDGSVWEDCKKSDCKKVGKKVKIGDLLEKIDGQNARFMVEK